ncbi:hypothetical protein Pla110_01150 [Polystyrenella longa]|uniref:Uncharacterized protein n=1 Tax=Polystyrenella longa TaxID=2528007 RepID=A0A518CGW5_9PLAN|nr:hypothetical protein Pla110_01150 [Polystyrenella longa]
MEELSATESLTEMSPRIEQVAGRNVWWTQSAGFCSEPVTIFKALLTDSLPFGNWSVQI